MSEENTTNDTQGTPASEQTHDENTTKIDIATDVAGVAPLQTDISDEKDLNSGDTPAENTNSEPQQGSIAGESISKNTDDAGIIAENADTVPVTSPASTGKKKKPVKNTPAINSVKTERLTMTVSFPGDESAFIKTIIDERVKAGMTRDNSHFIRQCVDFAVNYNNVFKRKGFGVPENTPLFYLKDAFFKNSK